MALLPSSSTSVGGAIGRGSEEFSVVTRTLVAGADGLK